MLLETAPDTHISRADLVKAFGNEGIATLMPMFATGMLVYSKPHPDLPSIGVDHEVILSFMDSQRKILKQLQYMAIGIRSVALSDADGRPGVEVLKPKTYKLVRDREYTYMPINYVHPLTGVNMGPMDKVVLKTRSVKRRRGGLQPYDLQVMIGKVERGGIGTIVDPIEVRDFALVKSGLPSSGTSVSVEWMEVSRTVALDDKRVYTYRTMANGVFINTKDRVVGVGEQVLRRVGGAVLEVVYRRNAAGLTVPVHIPVDLGRPQTMQF